MHAWQGRPRTQRKAHPQPSPACPTVQRVPWGCTHSQTPACTGTVGHWQAHSDMATGGAGQACLPLMGPVGVLARPS